MTFDLLIELKPSLCMHIGHMTSKLGHMTSKSGHMISELGQMTSFPVDGKS